MAIQVAGSVILSDSPVRLDNLNNIRFQTASSAPVALGNGQIYVNTTDNKAYVYASGGWQEIGNV